MLTYYLEPKSFKFTSCIALPIPITLLHRCGKSIHSSEHFSGVTMSCALPYPLDTTLTLSTFIHYFHCVELILCIQDQNSLLFEAHRAPVKFWMSVAFCFENFLLCIGLLFSYVKYFTNSLFFVNTGDNRFCVFVNNQIVRLYVNVYNFNYNLLVR